MATLAHLRSLYATIGNALEDIERVYREKSLDFPSPDVPIYSGKSALDTTDPSVRLTSDPVVISATNHITAACGQLATAVHNPILRLMDNFSTYYLTAGLHFLEASHTVEILRAAGPEGLHVDELVRRIDGIRAASGTVDQPLDTSRVAHILRLLATHQYTREVRPNVFANNRLSSFIDSGKTPEQIRQAPENKYDGTDGIAALISMGAKESFRAASYLTEYLLSPRQDAKYETAFAYAYQTQDNFYAWLERPENAFRLKQMSRSMSAGRLAEGGLDIANTSVVPWHTLPADSVVVDVGGGIGSVSVLLALAHPHLRFVVQDRAQTIEVAPTVWAGQHKELFESGRIAFQDQDFFEEQPKDLAPAVYLVTRVVHNLSDEKVKLLLSKLRAGAKPDTRLVIVDHILPLACHDTASSNEVSQAPLVPANSPLLPNLGKTFVGSYQCDLLMSVIFDGKERTAQEFVELARSTGWKVTRIERGEGTLFGCTTCVPI